MAKDKDVSNTDTKRKAELQKLLNRTIVGVEGSGLYDAPFTLVLDNGYVVEVYALGDDATRVYLNNT